MQTARILLFSAIVSFLLGCSRRVPEVSFPPARSEADSVTMNVGPYLIGSEQFQADYGTLTVPERRGEKTTRLISVPFLRIHSNSSNPSEPIFALAGGPGQANMAWDGGKARTFLAEHDFVMVGYRGVEGSSVLDCPEVVDAVKRLDDPLSEASLKEIAAAWSASSARLRAMGVDLDGYTMLECIEDNEAVRERLGYPRIDLLSESYGTRVAYLYALKHPDRVFRSAMISVNPPGHFVWDAQTIDAQLRHYADLWKKNPESSARCPDPYEAIRSVLNSTPSRWLVFPIDEGKVKVVTFALLFHRNTSALAFDAYVSASRGDPSGLALMSLAYRYTVPSIGAWGDLASKAVSADFDTTRDYLAETSRQEFPLGAPMTRFLWGSLAYGRLPIGLIPEEYRKLQSSNVQTLLLSGSVDFSTPPEFATMELLPYLRNGNQVILSECGHVNDVWYLHADNTKLILQSFFNTGVANTSLNTYIPMDFNVSWGFPVIAKVSLAVLALLIIAILAVSYWLIRRLRKRKAAMILSHGAE